MLIDLLPIKLGIKEFLTVLSVATQRKIKINL